MSDKSRYHDLLRIDRETRFSTLCRELKLNLHYVYECRRSKYITELKQKLAKLDLTTQWKQKWRFGNMSYRGSELLYSIVRSTNPELIIETGVSVGVSSSFLLMALEKNRFGKLISIDVEKDAGLLIDNKLKDRWTFLVGKSQKILPKLEVEKLDIFLHDSQHTYNTMMFEYEWSYPKLRNGGLLISHDIDANNSFFDLVDKKRENFFVIPTSRTHSLLGVIVKGFNGVMERKRTLTDSFQ